MKHLIAVLALLAVPLAPAMAQDFSANSEAREWNLYAEKKSRFDAKVVNVLCEMTGECSPNCGGGKEQMGLLRTADNVLLMGFKNSQSVFSGAAADLAPYCNQMVEVDGLEIDDPDLNAKNIYMVQRIRVEGSEDWSKANQFTKIWAKDFPDAKGKGPWFRRDPRIKEEIATKGYLGLGLEVDEAFIKDWF